MLLLNLIYYTNKKNTEGSLFDYEKRPLSMKAIFYLNSAIF
jgi:hypothetical protein